VAHRVLIVSAEASSALYARRLLEAWQKHDIKVSAFGVGDQKMLELGFQALGRSENMAVVGIKEVLRHYSHIKKVFYDILAECDREKPKFALLLDYPDFNFRLAKELKKRGIRVIYYISPQLWAWRKGRLSLVKKYIDKMLVLFPFEKDFYRENGVDVEFVGHPL
jgi:lipid-A-disaccharide synthase